MKKLLFISLLLSFCLVQQVLASVREVANPETASAVANRTHNDISIPNPVDRFEKEEDFKQYLINRLRKAVITKHDPNSGEYGGSASSVLKEELPEQYKQKSFYEQIYENAIKRATAQPDDVSKDIDPRILQPELWEKTAQSQASTIAVALPPHNEKIAVPPYEHIPYLFADIEVLPSGLLKIDETIVVISNAQKLRYPLSKALPTHMIDREGKPHKIEVNVNEVTINNYPIEYYVTNRGGNILITPVSNVPLDAGIYKYKFSYVVDYQIAYYDNFDELNWNVSGGNWNLVISRIGASVKLPYGSEPIGQRVLVGYPFHYSPERAIITRENANTIGFASKVPLFIAEGMPITVLLPKGTIEKPNLSKKINQLLLEHGSFIIPLIGFMIILLSYLASWRYIKKHHKKMPVQLKRTPQMLRFLLNGNFDTRAFGAFLLDMFRKNIIDIQKNDKNIMLIKRTDNLKSLSKKQQLAIKNIFAKEAVFTITTSSIAKLKQAMQLVQQETITEFKKFTFKLNFLYLLSGCGMLFFTELFIAYNMNESSKILYAILTMTIGIAIYLWAYKLRWKKKWLNIFVKLMSVIMIGLNFVMLSGICSLWGALLILISCLTIMFFSNLFQQRNGLVQANIIEAEQVQKHLFNNNESIVLGRDFANQQANIFAVKAETKYPISENIEEVYRLDVIKAIINKM